MCKMFRPLTADEVECRAAQVGKAKKGPWVSLLIYKDARVDQKLLDEVIGPMNWKNSYETIDGKLFCTVSIWDEEKGEWISKQNVGTESNTEAVKGEASDAFKRACFNFGIGRELYSSPKIFIDLEESEYDAERNRCKASFRVSEMESENGQITRLVIVDSKNKVRFSYGSSKTPLVVEYVSADGKSKICEGDKTWTAFVKRVAKDEVCEDGMPLSLKVQEYYNLPKEVMDKFYADVDKIRKR